jgi:hypothetical protein
VVIVKDENGRKRSKTDFAVSSVHFYILAIKEYKKWLKMVVKPIETDNFLCLKTES